MPKSSIEQSNTGAGAIQIAHVNGDVIIQMGQAHSDKVRGNDRREMGIALCGIAAMFLGVSMATPNWTLQASSYFIACGLTFVSGIVLATSRKER